MYFTKNKKVMKMKLLSFPSFKKQKDKVVVVLGSTGTGKSRLSIDLAKRFNAEIINSDKIQVYKGLDIVTNKVTDEESQGVPHHLLGVIDPDEDFTVDDFVSQASILTNDIVKRGRLPIIVGGSNSFIKALVVEDKNFRSKYECCFMWLDVSMPILHSFVAKRVDQMVESGLVDEVKDFYNPGGDYTRGIRRAIGVPEMDEFFRDKNDNVLLLSKGIDEIKTNTCELACRQLQNIVKLGEHLKWRMHRLEVTEVFGKSGVEADESWENLVAEPSTRIVSGFLHKKRKSFVMRAMDAMGSSNEVVAATR